MQRYMYIFIINSGVRTDKKENEVMRDLRDDNDGNALGVVGQRVQEVLVCEGKPKLIGWEQDRSERKSDVS